MRYSYTRGFAVLDDTVRELRPFNLVLTLEADISGHSRKCICKAVTTIASYVQPVHNTELTEQTVSADCYVSGYALPERTMPQLTRAAGATA